MTDAQRARKKRQKKARKERKRMQSVMGETKNLLGYRSSSRQFLRDL